MKKYITLAAVITISFLAIKKQPMVIIKRQCAKPVAKYYLHNVVRLMLKKVTNLNVMA